MQQRHNKRHPAMTAPKNRSRLGYFVARTLNNMRQNIFINLVTVGTITLALLIVALFMLLFVNLDSAAESWSEKVQVTVYFDKDVTQHQQAELKSKIAAMPATAKVKWIGREEAFQRFKGRLKGQEALLDGIRTDLLPASFEISLKKDNRSSDAIESYVRKLQAIPGMGEIQYGEEWVRRFNTFLTFLRIVGGLTGCFLVMAVVFIVSNTIQLTVYARRDELEAMWLVGATRLFIKLPFLLEGLIQGLIGGMLSILLLLGMHLLFLHNASNFLSFNPATAGLSFLPLEYVAGLIIAGVLLGFIGSLAALRRFINEITG